MRTPPFAEVAERSGLRTSTPHPCPVTLAVPASATRVCFALLSTALVTTYSPAVRRERETGPIHCRPATVCLQSDGGPPVTRARATRWGTQGGMIKRRRSRSLHAARLARWSQPPDRLSSDAIRGFSWFDAAGLTCLTVVCPMDFTSISHYGSTDSKSFPGLLPRRRRSLLRLRTTQ